MHRVFATAISREGFAAFRSRTGRTLRRRKLRPRGRIEHFWVGTWSLAHHAPNPLRSWFAHRIGARPGSCRTATQAFIRGYEDMPGCNNLITAQYRDQDELDVALRQGGLALDVRSNSAAPLNVEIGFRHTPCARALNVLGDPARVARGSREVSRDDGGFLGVLLQRMGHTLWSQCGRERAIGPGEIFVWHGRQSLDFRMPERFRKLCLLVPIERLEGVLPDSELHVGAYFKAGTNLANLLGACLVTLADNVLTSDDEPADAAVEVTLDMLGAALTRNKESPDENPRTSLFERIRSFIEKRIDDPDLSPSTIAQAHSISVRYLHLLFSERGVTVGGWIRLRRLAQCRIALTDARRERSITEIAMKWGFSDSAHFSRSFKAAFSISPSAFRRARTSARGAVGQP
jgi:AraC-like DNA-binding protein